MNTNMGRVKICPHSGQPKMTSWGIGKGVPPLTDDPENPLKPFAEYEMEDSDSMPQGRRLGLRKKISPIGGR